MDDACPFCLPAVEPRIVLRNDHCYTIWTEEIPLGSAMILPLVHRETVFDLTGEEWVSLRDLLAKTRELIAGLHDPDGWNVGWNVGDTGGQSVFHAHCHVIPRYRDEPLAGRGIRTWFKNPSNRPSRHPEPPPPSWRSADAAARSMNSAGSTSENARHR